MLAPITFPKLNEGAPEMAEEIPTNNSGKEVATAIIINAAENSLICKNLAIFVNDFTRSTPLTIKTAHDRVKYKIFSIIFSFL